MGYLGYEGIFVQQTAIEVPANMSCPNHICFYQAYNVTAHNPTDFLASHAEVEAKITLLQITKRACTKSEMPNAYDCKNYVKYTGDTDKTKHSGRLTVDWVREVQERGAGEIVLNCMNQDGVRQGYDIEQLTRVRAACSVPLIASGGAGAMEHFVEVFKEARVDGALAASVFHTAAINIQDLKKYLREQNVEIRE